MTMRTRPINTQPQRGSLQLVDPERIAMVTDAESPLGACPWLPRAWDRSDRCDRPKSDGYKEYVAHGMPLVVPIAGSRSLMLAKRRAEFLEMQRIDTDSPMWVEVLEVSIERALEMAIADLIYDHALHSSATRVQHLASYVDWLYRKASYRSDERPQSLKPVVRSLLAEGSGRPPIKEMIAAIAGYSSRVTREISAPNRQSVAPRGRATGDRPYVRGSAQIRGTEIQDPVHLKRGPTKTKRGQLELIFHEKKRMDG